MKLLRYGPAGLERPGLLDAEGRIRDLSAHVHDIAGTTLLPSNLQRLAAIDHARLPLVEEGVRVGPCVGKVGKVVVVEAGSVELVATSALSGPGDAVVLPPGLRVRCVARLGVVIGQRARRVPPEQALAHVAGYCLLAAIVPEDASRRHLDTFAPLGPFLLVVPAQAGIQAMADEPVAAAVADTSECMTLHPGDLLSLPLPVTATPLCIGDSRRITIAGLGEQHLRAIALAPQPDPVEQEP